MGSADTHVLERAAFDSLFESDEVAAVVPALAHAVLIEARELAGGG